MKASIESEQTDWLIKELFHTKVGEMLAFLACTPAELILHYWNVARNYQRLNDKDMVEVPSKAIAVVDDLCYCFMQLYLETVKLKDDLDRQNLNVAARKLQQEAAGSNE